MDFQAVIATSFGKLGIQCSEQELLGVDFLPSSVRVHAPKGEFAIEVVRQLNAYFADADFRFDLPLKLEGSAHQLKVWHMMQIIPRGQTLSYGELAAEICSSARAVGQACGHNPIPVIVPCHRVVGKAGLGGFMHRGDKAALDVKRWLLAHEQH